MILVEPYAQVALIDMFRPFLKLQALNYSRWLLKYRDY